MSPTSTSSSAIYDHLMINFPQKQQQQQQQQHQKLIMRNNSKKSSNNIYDNSTRYFQSNSQTDCEHLLPMKKTQSLPIDDQQRAKRRFTITHITTTEPVLRCSVSNQAYEKAILRPPLSTSNHSLTSNEIHPETKYSQPAVSSNVEVKPMDFRPLIINGRRRFSTISSTTPMVVIKKKSPSPMKTTSFTQKPLFRSIPVHITSNNPAMLVRTVIPTSLSYSSSCCSSSATSTSSSNVGTVSVPIQVIKTQKRNNNSISTSTSTSTINTLIESQKGYRFIPKQSPQSRPLLNLKAGNQIQPLPILSDDDDDDESTKIPSSSSGSGDGYRSNSTVMADSHVLRLIRRYDPVAATSLSIRPRRSLENTRSAYNSEPPKPVPSFPPNIFSSSCLHLAQRPLRSVQEDNRTVKQLSTPCLQRQKAIPEQEFSSNVADSIQPILKYTSPTVAPSRAESNLETKKTEPLTIEIEPHIPPPIPNGSAASYQPLITTAPKRVCSAISKSEWDLRLQQDLPSPVMPTISPLSKTTTPALPVQLPSSRTTNNQLQEKQSYRPLLGRSKSTMVINNSQNDQDKDMDDFDENSAPITAGTCVGRLKQMFNSKTSLDSATTPLHKNDRVNSIESNLNRPLQANGTNLNKSELISSTTTLNRTLPNSKSTDLQARTMPNTSLTKPTTLVQQSAPVPSPLLKRPILRSQKTLDSTESLNRPNNSSTMPSSEFSYDAYRFRRLNETDQMTSTTPATRLRNVAKVEPYSINTNMVRPLYQSSLLTSKPTSTSRITLNSTGNTPTNSSTSSSAASLGNTIRHPNVRQSDFLIPNPGYSTAPPPPPPSSSQLLSNSSSYTTLPSTSILLSESLSHPSTHGLPSTANSPLCNGRSTGLTSSINTSLAKHQSSLQGDFHSNQQTYHNGSSSKLNQNSYKKLDNHSPINSYHYRPKELAASTTSINTPLTNCHQQSYGFVRAATVEKQPLQHQAQVDERGSLTQQPRRRFQRRKQMKRSKSADLYQEPSSTSTRNLNMNNYPFSTTANDQELNRYNRQQRSTSRDLIGGGDGNLSNSSTSSSSMSHLERINRAALLRYKSLDSMTFNNKKSSFNGKYSNRRQSSRPIAMDYDSDDSVCGIPKPRKICSGSKNVARSERILFDSTSTEKDQYTIARAISIHDIGITGTSTGITNSVRNNEHILDRTHTMLETNPSLQLSSSSSLKTTNGKRDERNIMQEEQQSGRSFNETQFYARTAPTPIIKRRNLIYQKSDEIYSTPPIEDTFHDAIDDLNTNKDQIIDDKNMPTKIYIDWSSPYENEPVQNQELFITEPTDVKSHKKISFENEKSTIKSNPFERLRPLDVESKSTSIISPSTVSLVRPLKSSLERMRHTFDDDNNDSSTSTTSRSVHIAVEKQRGLSEIIRKRNSRFKVEDYKRSIQKSNTFDVEQLEPYRTMPISRSDCTLSDHQTTNSTIGHRFLRRLNKTKSVDVDMEYKRNLTNFDENDEINEKMTVATKKSLFETVNNDKEFGRGLTRSKSFKQESSSSFINETRSLPLTKIDVKEQQLTNPEIDQTSIENENRPETFHDDTSKLTFKEKMTLFNITKINTSTNASSLKSNRNRLTQPITAEEVQAAENFSIEPSPSSSSNQISKPTTTASTSDKPLMHEYVSSNEILNPPQSILRTSNLQENSLDQEHVKNLIKHNSDDTTMLSQEEVENMIPVSKRLEQLKTHGENEWKKRVKSTNDANEFTIEGKLRQAGKLLTPTEEQKSLSTSTRKGPTLKYNSKKPSTIDQRSKTVDIVRLKTDSVVKTKDTTSPPTKKANGTTSNKSNNHVVSVLKSDTISVLKPDDHFDEFFADGNKRSNSNDSSVQLNTDDLNHIAENAVRLQSQPARVRPPRRQQQGAKNPLRQIQATISTSNEYTEVHTNLSEQELRRLKRAQIAENAGLAQEALAALAATENFAEINLRKIDRAALATFGFEPYKDIMLILIKGRRHCSLRLINPLFESINEGDCYILITPNKVFAWIGQYANALEKAKTLDIIDFLKQHRDFGLRSEAKYFVLDQANDDTEDDIHAEFADILHGDDEEFKSIDTVTDDDFYEANVMEFNRVYRVDNDMLIPLHDFCFRSLSVKILDPNDVFVFDFGSELYVWNGKYADKNKRNMGIQLAQQLWNDPYDFSECLINPFDPFDDKNESGGHTGTKRPDWCIFGKQNQNVETLLFKGKFYDWPGDLKELKPVNDAANNINRIPSARRPPSIVEMLKPADVRKMLEKKDNPVNMILEQSNLGRGKHWYDPIELRGHDIQTISLNVWHVADNERQELSKSSYGQFYSDDVYIIRWRYKLVASGFHSIKTGQASIRKTDTGRDRVAYWIWQGKNASPNEKGLSALMTVFLDEEKGPHVHVIQEHEEATFLQLFDGTLTIHMGKRNQSKQKKSSWRLYVFLGEIDVETHWWEINVDCTNLRSRTSFLFVNNTENCILLWHGCGTTNEQKALANQSALKLRERCPEEFHFNVESEEIEFREMQEGDEFDLFWNAINQRTYQRTYNSLLNVPLRQKLTATMRIFHLSSLHGPFVAQELNYILRSPDHISAFPFTQADLYDLPQPALCLIDTETDLYIWQGWNDVSDDELDLQLSNANLQAGAPRDLRFTAERRCAFRTAVEYRKAKTSSSTIDIPCSIVYAGLEPIEFINLFPKWTVHTKARQQNQLEGKKLNQKDSISDILKQLCREQYTIEELRSRPLPEGVDPSKIESYLSDEDFLQEFRMTKDEYYALPYWKQTNIKKPLGFF